MQPAKAVGVRCFNVESESALRRLSEMAHDRALATYPHAASLPGLKRVTIDCPIGSQIAQAAAWLGALDRLLDLLTSVEAAGIPIHDMDMVGDLGIPCTGEQPPRADELVARRLARLDARVHGHRAALLEARPLTGGQCRCGARRGAMPQAR